MPDCDNGWLKIANELADAFASAKLTMNEWQIVWCVIRMTYGFKKKQSVISLGVFEKKTGIDRRIIHRTIKNLETKNILIVDRQGYKNTTYKLQKYYEKWQKDVICRDDNLSSAEMTSMSSAEMTSPITLYLKKKERKDKERENPQPDHSLDLANVKNKNNSDDIFSEQRKKSSQEKRPRLVRPYQFGELLNGIIADKN